MTEPARSWFRELAPAISANGFPVLPASGKAVLVKDWPTIEITPDRIDRWSQREPRKNVSIRTGDGLVAIDIDSLDAALSEAIEASAVARFGSDCMIRIGRAPKRLLVYRCDDPAITKLKVTLADPNGERHAIELLGKGQQFVAYGIHPDTGLPYQWVSSLEPAESETWEVDQVAAADLRAWFDELPSLCPPGWSVAGASSAAAGDDDFLGNYRAPVENVDLEQLRSTLAELDPDMDHDEWVRVGMALHHQFRGERQGLDLWEAWSAEGKKHQPGVCAQRWQSFRAVRDGAAVTLRSIIGRAREARSTRVIGEQVKATDSWRQQVLACADRAALEELAVRARRECRNWPKADAEVLAQAYQERFKALTGAKLPVALAREAIGLGGKIAQAKEARRAGDDVPDWLSGWVYLTDRDKFFHLRTKESVTRIGFDARFNRKMTSDNDDSAVSAAKAATDVWQVPVVSGARYMPMMGDLFSINGQEFANLFRQDSAPAVPDPFEDDDLAAIATVEKHFDLFFPDPVERGHIVDWLAHNVQFPGIKIRWSPLIKGIEGDGKSLLMTLLQAAMGQENVRPIAAHVIEKSEFTGWAVGQCVLVIEELKLQGHNRWDVANKLKPYITNDEIPVNAKFVDPFMAPNTTNYMALTNYTDSLPISDTDRRYAVFFSPFDRREQLVEAIGDPADYFERLHAAMRDRQGAIRAWLLARDLTGFNRHGNAPETQAKATMRELSCREDEELARRLIEKGAPGVSASVLSSSALKLAIQHAEEGGLALETSRLNALISKLGYRFFDRVKWRGAVHRVWVKGSDWKAVTGDELGVESSESSRAAVRNALEGTEGGGEEVPF